jgi:hypothetical protein
VLRELEAGVPDCRPDPVPALANGCIWQADHRESRQAKRDVNLDLDGVGLDAEHGRALQAGKHLPGSCKALRPPMTTSTP